MLLPSQEGFIGRPLDLVLEIQQQRRGDQLAPLRAIGGRGARRPSRRSAGDGCGLAVRRRGWRRGLPWRRRRRRGRAGSAATARRSAAATPNRRYADPCPPILSLPVSLSDFSGEGNSPRQKGEWGFPTVPAVPAGRGRRAWGRSERGGAGGLRVQNRNGTRWPVRLDLRIASMITATR